MILRTALAVTAVNAAAWALIHWLKTIGRLGDSAAPPHPTYWGESER